ncbi:hypothetical protein SCO01_24320 [Staphylococcus cohnii subsp. cohnii]|nr:hypothetical protein SCO01_24320 [Staphylococcus cohnii subsp. cohnii]
MGWNENIKGIALNNQLRKLNRKVEFSLSKKRNKIQSNNHLTIYMCGYVIATEHNVIFK